MNRYSTSRFGSLLAWILAAAALACLFAPLVSPAHAAPDATTPTLEMAGIPVSTTVEDALLIQGVARDQGADASGVADVAITSDVLGATLSAAVDAGGSFSLEVPLGVGANAIEIVARDHADNVSETTSFTVTRELTEVPQLVIDGPNAGHETTDTQVSIHGRVLTALGAESLSIRLGELRALPLEATDGFAFSFDDLELEDGVNVFDVAVFSPHGSTHASVSVRRVVPSSATDPLGPTIELATGSDVIVVTGSSYTVSGVVRSDDCVASILVDGLQPEDTLDTASGVVSFSSTIPIGQDASYPVAIVAEGCNGVQSEQEILLVHDESPPVLVLSSPLDLGATIEVVQNPVAVTGTIDEAHLAGAMIGRINGNGAFEGQPLVLEPEATEGLWRFSARVHLDRAQDTTVVISAWDRAGYQTQVDFTARLEHDVSLALLSPKDGDQVGVTASETTIPVSVRVLDAGITDSIVAQLDGGDTVVLGHGSGNHSGELSGLTVGASHVATVRIEDAGGTVLAQTDAEFSAVDLDSVPVAVVQQIPSHGAEDVESNQSLTLSLNRAVDPELVTVTVHETVHGFVYQSAQVDADILTQSRVERVRVDRSDEPVPGRTHNLPGDRAYEFFPYGEWTYGAEIEVEMLVDGVSVGRTRFTVRGLPTLAHAFVVDQDERALSTIDVELPELGHTVTTDGNGLFSLGWGWTADEPLPPGLHKIIINPGAKNPAFGVIEGWMTVQAEEVNGGASYTLPRIRNPRFASLEGGSRQVLENGRLVLGLEDAELTFAGGDASGAVAPQMLPFTDVGYPAVDAAHPLFAIRLEPGELSVSGPMTVEIAMPRQDNSYDYIDVLPRKEGHKPLALLFVLDPGGLALRPLSVVEIDPATRRAVTPHATSNIARLDVLALGLVPISALDAATDYVAGDAEFSAVLAALQTP